MNAEDTLTPAQSVALDHYRHGTPLLRMIAPSTRAALVRMGFIRIESERMPHGGPEVYYVVVIPHV